MKLVIEFITPIFIFLLKGQNILRNAFSIVLLTAMVVLTLPLLAAAQEEGKIAFRSSRAGSWDIYAMNADGSVQTRLTDHPAEDLVPSLSRDGSRVVFQSTRNGQSDVYVMNSDGSNQINLTPGSFGDIYPSFSADGSRIVFVSGRDGNSEIYVMNADGSDQTNLTFFAPATDLSPAFSPDGSRIVFQSNRDGNDEIYVMNADGSGAIRLTNNAASDEQPTFSADGSRIAFTSNRDGNKEIYVMNADGTGQTNLSNNAAGDEDPSYSPDGNRIAFTSNRDGNLEIYAMNAADGASQVNVSNQASPDFEPSWGGSPTAPPSAAVLSNVLVTSPITENGFAVLSGSISDADAGDAFTLTVDWGDGSAPQIFNYPAGTTAFNETHQYPDDDPTATSSDNYAIGLTLSDGTLSDTGSATLTVNNAAPVISGITANPSTVAVGGATVLSGSVSDAGSLDTHTIQINWGDGSPATTLNLAAGVSAFSASHQYDSVGVFPISVSAADDDGGTAAVQGGATVNSNPTTAPNAPANLRIATVGANQVSLAWDDNSDNESGFIVERCRSKNCNNFVAVGQTSANATGFTDTNLFSSVHYYYRVRAVNIVGASVYSNTVGIKTLK